MMDGDFRIALSSNNNEELGFPTTRVQDLVKRRYRVRSSLIELAGE